MIARFARLAIIVTVCAACSRGGGAKVDTAASDSRILPTPAGPDTVGFAASPPPADSAAFQKRAPKATVTNAPLPSRARVTRKPDSIIGYDSVIRLPRRTLPRAKPTTP